MSVSGLKAELKLLESIFGRDHERFRIVSWKLDELHCHFLLLPAPKTPDAPGPGRPPPPPLAIHCNITVGPRACPPASAHRGGGSFHGG
ncbi:UNVERIFIED_CONTAM: Ubiquitin-conjugating enzyme E2 Q2, partial [Gekko kuhli]